MRQGILHFLSIIVIISIFIAAGCGGGSSGAANIITPTSTPSGTSAGSLTIRTDQIDGYATCDLITSSSAASPYSQVQLDSNGDGTFYNLPLNNTLYIRLYDSQTSFQNNPEGTLAGQTINFTANGQEETVTTGTNDPTPTPTPGTGSTDFTNLFFLHHSTGAGIIGGNVRETIDAYNSSHGTGYEFWDHGYNGDGLTNASGQSTGTNYSIPNDNTDPDGLYYLFTSSNEDAAYSRNLIMTNHEVIAFKSCFPASAIDDQDMLNQYKAWYLEMRDYFDRHPERLFVVMSTPPLHRLSTNSTQAANARAFANWLKSSEYLSGHSNIVCFDLFDYLAGSDNMLKYEYEGSHDDGDSHPNNLANQTVGPIFANFLINSAENY